ncbi:aromatic prenyltransferase (plasmid) [Streptomyces sp. FXJ1.172]|uniref:aromatic prenyltransferase n=1 Tax=Streptomyces sp. FXJ1.172 TaxID=710705 RepID=UPI0023DD5860|nr:aromatic prenyltransferase [Streptomyces sp. FXJ1.172]WEP01005.1 aromatic prenyltransferase [Streptomyces sp. FXJ1.172]
MSRTAEIERVYSAIEEGSRLLGAACSRDKVLPVLDAFGDALPEAMIVFGGQAGDRHKGELDYSFTVPRSIGDPYPHALSKGLVAETDHPVGSVLSDIQGRWPIGEYFVDAGVVGGFKKLYAHFPDDMQKVSEIAAIPSMPRAVAANADLFARYGLDKVAMVGVDYRHKTVSVYFHFGPDGRPTPGTIRAMLGDLHMPDPAQEMLEFAHRSFRANITLGWDSPDIIRVAFAPPPVRGLDPSAVPGRMAPGMEEFARTAPRVYTGGRVNLYAVKWMRGEEFLEVNTYYQLAGLQEKLVVEAPREQG